MREKQRRIAKLLALQERRLMAETANCATVEKRLQETDSQICDLQRMLERDDPTAMAFSTLVLDRLRQASRQREELESELARRRDAALILKQQIKRIDKYADRIDDKATRKESERERSAILERFSTPRDASVE
ncbi:MULTISPECIES: hypothetical protein [Methylocystis]|uniref:hypothetical protein n=1 Tax=Methylocystis TaxID=133 RepID=UPI0019205CC7|nr:MULTISPECIES: hypothetical protein [Methylocystis]MBL1258656.1 hypothetical protein [Methylocystis sp. Sn-Cys]